MNSQDLIQLFVLFAILALSILVPYIILYWFDVWVTNKLNEKRSQGFASLDLALIPVVNIVWMFGCFVVAYREIKSKK